MAKFKILPWVQILFLGFTAKSFASATPDPMEQSCIKFMYAESEVEQSKARAQLREILNLEEYVRFLRTYKTNPTLKQGSESDMESLAQGLLGIIDPTEMYAKACILAQAESKVPPTQGDLSLILKLVELEVRVFDAAAVISDIRIPGTQTAIKDRETSKFLQGCGFQLTKLAQALAMLGFQLEREEYIKLGLEVWRKASDAFAPDVKQLVGALPLTPDTSLSIRKTIADEYINQLRLMYPDRKKSPPLAHDPKALSPEQAAKKDSRMKELQSIIEQFHQAINQGDEKTILDLVSPNCKKRAELVADAKERKYRVSTDQKTDYHWLKDSQDSTTIWVSSILKMYSDEKREFRTDKNFSFVKADGIKWIIMDIGD